MLKASLRFAWRSLTFFNRIVLVGAVLLAFAFAALLLALRYWVLPDIERYHDEITAAAGRAIGQRVSVERIEADWQGFRPHLLLSNVRVLDERGQTALGLQKVESEVSWTSLFTGEVRLYSLELDQPDLLIRRDVQGELFIAGVHLSGASTGAGASDWLLNQSRMVVRDARITWQDELRGVPPLVFNEVNLLIDNGWRRHRFAVRALPPKALSGLLDVRGDFYGLSFDQPEDWRGQLFAQVDYADVAAWRPWVTLPVSLSHGMGALRGWMDVEHGKIHGVTADVALSGVRTRLSENLPALDLRTMRGRVGWDDIPNGVAVFTRQLSLRLANGSTLPPTDFYLRYAAAQGSQPANGEVRANLLDMQILSALSEFLPFDRSLKQKLAEYAPRGRVSDLYAKWQGEPDKLKQYELRAHFDDLSARRVGAVPGFSGLTGEVDGSDASGALVLNSRKLTLDAPAIMQEALLFDAVTAQINWQSSQHGLEVSVGNVLVANADMRGNLYGNYRSAEKGPGVVDITGHFTHAEVQHVDRYIPRNAINAQTHGWLSTALLGGHSDQLDFTLRGDLAEFPFTGNRTGLFRIRARLKDAELKYAKDWPEIDRINGELLIEGMRLEVRATSARTLDNPLQKVNVVLPDMTSPDLHLQIYGEAAGEVASALEYVRQSPVRGYIGGFTDNVIGHGNGLLNLALDIPLRGGKAKVNGAYHFLGDEIDLGHGVPVLRAASGDLMFSESGVRTQNLRAQVLGGPATGDVHTEEGILRVSATGVANLDAMHDGATIPLLRYLRGSFPWETQVTVQNGQAGVLVTSNLVGLTSTLPAPFAKRPGDSVPVRFERREAGDHQDLLSLQYGTLLGAKFLRRNEDSAWKIKRGTVSFGSSKRWLERDGIWILGTVPQLSLEGWGALGGGAKGAGASMGDFAIAGADVQIQKLTGFGQSINNIHVTAHTVNDVLFAQLASRDMNGAVTWQPQDQGALVVRLKNLVLSGAEAKKEKGAGAPETVVEHAAAGDSPELYFSVESLTYSGKQLGKLDIQAKERAGNWLLEHIELTNPDGKLTGDGKWLSAELPGQTQVNFKLEILDAGKVLDRSGYPNSVKKGGGSLEASLAWRGGPGEFSYATLGGTLNLNVREGRFLKIDPGVGKLLGILSLQALPQHIKLDFTDVFSEGFAFDRISGTAQIKQGVLTTNDFKVDGSAADVVMTGDVDLMRETQNLHVIVLTQVSSVTTVVALIAGGIPAAVSVLIADKLLKNPLEKLASFEYNVTGTWADPTVVKVGSHKLSPK